MLNSLQDVCSWLATQAVSSSDLDMESVREAVAVLTRAPRPKREDVRPLLRKWLVVCYGVLRKTPKRLKFAYAVFPILKRQYG